MRRSRNVSSLVSVSLSWPQKFIFYRHFCNSPSSVVSHKIAYTHLRGLGTPKEGRTAAKAGRQDEFQRIFAAHMKTEIAQKELQRAALTHLLL